MNLWLGSNKSIIHNRKKLCVNICDTRKMKDDGDGSTRICVKPVVRFINRRQT